MARFLSIPINFGQGFYPGTSLVGENSIKDAIQDGQNVLFLGPGVIKSAKGLGNPPPTGGTGGNRLYLTDDLIGACFGKGSIVPYRNRMYFFLSTGKVTLGSTIISASGNVASTTGRLQYSINGQVYNAGLEAPARLETLAKNPSAVNKIEAGAASTKNMMGTYAVVLTKKRSWSGEESNGSDPSDIIAINNTKIQLTTPASPVSTNADFFDTWSVYISPSNQATVGPFKFYKDYSAGVSGGTQTVITLDFTDAELKALQPPITNNIPPNGKFVVAMGDRIIVLGTYDGLSISPSKSTDPGSYEAKATTQLNPVEEVVGLACRPTENELLIWTMNSLQSLVLTGSSVQPVLPRALWPTTGIMSPHGGCFADAQFYCFISESGPARLGNTGDPDTSFALPVREYIKSLGWDATQVVVGYDPVNDAVLYCHGNTAIPYMRSLGIWSCPINLNVSGQTIQSAVTYRGKLYLGFNSGASYSLVEWEGGLANPSWYFIPTWQDAPDPMNRKTVTGLRVCGDPDTITGEMRFDFSNTTPSGCTLTDTADGKRYTDWLRMNKKCRVYTCKISGTKSDEVIYNIQARLLHTQLLRESD